MANPACPKCGAEGWKRNWDTLTDQDRMSGGHAMASSMRSPAKSPQEMLVKFALYAGSQGVKVALSKVYSCSKCDNTWRKWF